MKKIFISTAIAAILFAGCSGNQTKEHKHDDGTHQHDDGSVHQNHEEDTVVKQEEFTAPADTVHSHDDIKQHSHVGHEHPHQH